MHAALTAPSWLELHRDVLPDGQDLRLKDVNLRFRPLSFPHIKDSSGFYKFSVVRNPYARLVSAYLDKCFEFKYPPVRRYKNEQLVESNSEAIFKFLKQRFDLEIGYSFNDFVDYLQHSKQRNYRGVNMHFLRSYRGVRRFLWTLFTGSKMTLRMKERFRKIFQDNAAKRQQAEQVM